MSSNLNVPIAKKSEQNYCTLSVGSKTAFKNQRRGSSRRPRRFNPTHAPTPSGPNAAARQSEPTEKEEKHTHTRHTRHAPRERNETNTKSKGSSSETKQNTQVHTRTHAQSTQSPNCVPNQRPTFHSQARPSDNSLQRCHAKSRVSRERVSREREREREKESLKRASRERASRERASRERQKVSRERVLRERVSRERERHTRVSRVSRETESSVMGAPRVWESLKRVGESHSGQRARE